MANKNPKKKLRVVVEVEIPTTASVSEKHLQEHIHQYIPNQFRMYGLLVSPRIKVFTKLCHMLNLSQNGISHFGTKEENND